MAEKFNPDSAIESDASVSWFRRFIGGGPARPPADPAQGQQPTQDPRTVGTGGRRISLGDIRMPNRRTPVAARPPEPTARAGGEASDRGRAERFDAGRTPTPVVRAGIDLPYGISPSSRGAGEDQ
jgi:hypothetical protein